MKILLINPNQYHHPPVIPLAIEYLAGELAHTHHQCAVLDLCFSDNPVKDIKNKIIEYHPDIIGVTIRQVDTALYPENEFQLDKIKDFVSVCKSHHLPVILGGAGCSIMPKEIITFTGADYAITGPGEKALPALLDMLENKQTPAQIIHGYDHLKTHTYTFNRVYCVDYEKYIKNDGIIGFRTKIGCTDNCFFCTEREHKMVYHTPEAVGKEIKTLKNKNFKRFHLCDSEFNINTEHCIAVCKAIIKHAGKIDWVVYMKLKPFSAELFHYMHQTGVSAMTLSIDSEFCTPKYFADLTLFLKLAQDNGIDVAIDMSIGYPYEDINHTQQLIEFLDTQPIDTIGINSHFRVYPGTRLFDNIQKDEKLQQYLINDHGKEGYFYPVFFAYFTVETIRNLIGNSSKFRVEGFDKTTNYQRLGK
jgi:radical SAM superfamily enzyme YgiQ (UPF0313 family)